MEDFEYKLIDLGYSHIIDGYYRKTFKCFYIFLRCNGVTLICPIIDMCRDLPFTEEYIDLYKQALQILEGDFKILLKILKECETDHE